jgi:hypothetical protein
MDNQLENNDWMNQAPHLAKLPRTNPFTVPQEYFETLPSNINSAIYFDSLKQHASTMDGSVPPGYFEQAKQDIYSRIAEENIKELVQEDGFAVPEGYFTNLNNRISLQLTEPKQKQQKTKLFKLWHSRAMKYATAACIVIISSVGLYMNYQGNGQSAPRRATITVATSEEQALFDIDEQSVIEQVQSESSGQSANTNATQSEMEDYILNNYSQNDIASNM